MVDSRSDILFDGELWFPSPGFRPPGQRIVITRINTGDGLRDTPRDKNPSVSPRRSQTTSGKISEVSGPVNVFWSQHKWSCIFRTLESGAAGAGTVIVKAPEER